jgi:hypothetical protein
MYRRGTKVVGDHFQQFRGVAFFYFLLLASAYFLWIIDAPLHSLLRSFMIAVLLEGVGLGLQPYGVRRAMPMPNYLKNVPVRQKLIFIHNY